MPYLAVPLLTVSYCLYLFYALTPMLNEVFQGPIRKRLGKID
jgi:hypothetical protein